LNTDQFRISFDEYFIQIRIKFDLFMFE